MSTARSGRKKKATTKSSSSDLIVPLEPLDIAPLAKEDEDMDDFEEDDEESKNVSTKKGSNSRKRSSGTREPRAVIAKRSRDKRSAKMHALEMEVTRLREQNRQLLIRSSKGMSRRSKEQEQQRVQALKELVQMVQNNAPEVDIKFKLGRYREKYSDFGEERATRVKFHVNQLRELIFPTEVSRVFFSLMDHWEGRPDPATYEGEQSVREIWEAMKTSLQVTLEQQNEFLSLGGETREQERTMKECFQLLESLERNFEAKSEGMEMKMDQLTKIISPAQSVLFLNWIENNKPVLHMIDEAEFRRDV